MLLRENLYRSKDIQSLFRSCTENTSNESNSHQVLLSRSPNKAHNYSEFQDAVRLFYDKKSAGEYNHTKLTQLDTPIAVVNAIHSGPSAATDHQHHQVYTLPY